MIGVRMVTLKILRTYVSKPKFNAVGIKGKLKITQMEGSEHDPEDFDRDDIDEFESDFMNVHVSHKLHEREMERSKESLRQRITRSKYFKDQQPRFITYVEKDQIQNLHKSDPKEWTPEKLSESFPALPETIRKILKSKWVPKSVDTVINYDKLAIENWKNFKTGKLVVDPALDKHLMKFKNRKISLTDRKTLSEKFVPPKMEFPKPESTLFSSIVKDVSVNSKQPMYKEKQISSNEYPHRDERRVATINETSTEMSVIQTYNIMNKEHNKKKYKKEGKLTINEFMKEKLKTLYETSPEEGITLLTTYRKHIESRTLEDVNANVLTSAKKEAEVEEDTSANVLASSENEAEVEEDTTANVLTSSKKETEVGEDTSAKVLSSSENEAEVEEDTSANVLASSENEAEVEEDTTANVLTSSKKETEVEEDTSANVLASSENDAEVEEDTSANVLASSENDAEVEEDTTANVLTSSKKETEVGEDISANILVSSKKEAEVGEDNVPMVKTPPKETALMAIAKQTQAKLPIDLNTESSSLDTYVKEWNSSVETKFNYAKSIRIPKNVYKEGMSYRIKDCYYDDDGEFLFRVPGVRG
ncbi:uncharacterized protein LOC143369908 [Andrena cerasifolii]|uniref:uncharacterized protein LOC143369908 n=1 Tax=Andrena cerasifolii TaxID=2819439 RepID=UPI004037C492